MSNTKPDIGGYPVLRLDQICLIDSTTLATAEKDVNDLIASLKKQGDTHMKMIYYLNRQIGCMQKELATRAAEERVRMLLEGAPPTISTISHEIENHKVESNFPSSVHEPPLPSPIRPTILPVPKFIPLPSELRRSTVTSSPAESRRFQESKTVEIGAKAPLNNLAVAVSVTDEPLASSRSIDSNRSREGNETNGIHTSSNRPVSGNHRPRMTKAMEENFASSFMVAPTEKKIRFYPKKTIQLTDEQVKEKARDARRKIAMKRLMDRKENQKAILMAQKRKRKMSSADNAAVFQKASDVNTTKDTGGSQGGDIASDGHSSSDSEYLSGGDDADEIVEVASANAATPISGHLKTESEGEKERGIETRDPHSSKKELSKKDLLIANLSNILSIESEIVQSKNLSALNAIRKMKADKMQKSVIEDLPLPLHASGTIVHMSSSVSEEANLANENKITNAHLSFVRNEKEIFRLNSSNQTSDEKVGMENNEGSKSLLDMFVEETTTTTPTTTTSPVVVVDDRSECNHALHVEKSPPNVENVVAENCIYTILSEEVDSASGDSLYRASIGPDDLPGLRAWVLDSVNDQGDVVWLVDISQYTTDGTILKLLHDGQVSAVQDLVKEDTFDALSMRISLVSQRMKVIKKVSYGIYMFVKRCELFLTKSVTTGGFHLIHTDAQFRAMWCEVVHQFDTYADLLPDSEILFTELNVCGNLYYICKKIENLLKTSVVATSSNKHVSQCWGKVESSNFGDIAVEENTLITNNLSEHSLQEENIQVSRSVDTPASVSQDILTSPPPSALRTRPKKVSMSEGIIFGKREEGNNDGDDDEPIMPNDSFEMSNNTQYIPMISSRPPSSQLDSKKVVNDQVSTRRSGRQSIIRAPSQKVNELMEISDSRRKLTDVYPSFGSIFPAVQALYSSARPGDHSTIAKVMVESMLLQQKTYDEWIEVMEDYATVFSHGDYEDTNAKIYQGSTNSLHYRVASSRPEVTNIVNDVFKSALKTWVELPEGLGLGLTWNLLWSWGKPKVNYNHLLVWQKVNHFHDSKQLTRKDLLKKNIQRYTDMTGKVAASFEIMPKTFILPHEYTLFVKAFMEIEALKNQTSGSDHDETRKSSIKNIWIMKPVGLSRGRGISLVQDLTSLQYSHTSVLQKYIENPLCIGGYKFDLRLYVLVTSFQPLEAFIYQEGFARVSTEQYVLDGNSLNNLFIHLTNSSIQKHNATGPTKDNPLTQGDNAESNGSKIGLLGTYGLWTRLREIGVDVETMWKDICTLIVKSLVVVDDTMVSQPCCFELFGYDVLLDSNYRPWLLEVNASPSLARENQLDIRVKNELVRDTILLVDPAPYDRSAIVKIIKKRLKDLGQKQHSGSKQDPDLESHLKSILGDYTPRLCGEDPRHFGKYERLCPGTKFYEHALRLKSKIIKTDNPKK